MQPISGSPITSPLIPATTTKIFEFHFVKEGCEWRTIVETNSAYTLHIFPGSDWSSVPTTEGSFTFKNEWLTDFKIIEDK